jgi:hypothetical protein
MSHDTKSNRRNSNHNAKLVTVVEPVQDSKAEATETTVTVVEQPTVEPTAQVEQPATDGIDLSALFGPVEPATDTLKRKRFSNAAVVAVQATLPVGNGSGTRDSIGCHGNQTVAINECLGRVPVSPAAISKVLASEGVYAKAKPGRPANTPVSVGRILAHLATLKASGRAVATGSGWVALGDLLAANEQA